MPTTIALPRRILLDALFAVVAMQCLYVLWPFLSPMLWALILAYVTWPLYGRGRDRMGPFKGTAALLMTLLVSCADVLPIVWLLVLLQDEILHAYELIANYVAQGPHANPPALRDIPRIGRRLQEGLDRYAVDPSALERQIVTWLRDGAGYLPGLLGTIGSNLGRFALTVFTLFVFYRDGELLVSQDRRIAERFVGARLDPYLMAAGVMTRAVMCGVVVTAFAQGMIAGIWYVVVGLDAPVLLGTLRGVLSVFPVLGTAFVWGPLGIWLLLTDHVWRGAILLAWGTLLVHPTDNVLRQPGDVVNLGIVTKGTYGSVACAVAANGTTSIVTGRDIATLPPE